MFTTQIIKEIKIKREIEGFAYQIIKDIKNCAWVRIPCMDPLP